MTGTLVAPMALARLATRETPAGVHDCEGTVRPLLGALARGDPLPLPPDPVDRALGLLRAARASGRQPGSSRRPSRSPRSGWPIWPFWPPSTWRCGPDGDPPALPGGSRAGLAHRGRVGAGGLGPAAFRFLWGEGRPLPPEKTDLPLVAPSLRVPAVMVGALRQAFVETARKEARSAPIGPVRVPAGLLDTTGPAGRPRGRLRLWVGYLRSGGGAGGGRPVRSPASPCRWKPERAFRPFLTPAETAVGLDLLLAALWHDLRVGGPAAFPAERSRPAGHGLARSEGLAPSPGGASAPRTRPAPVRRTGDGRSWGTAADRAQVRRAHLVQGHSRQLPSGRMPHPEAGAQAVAFGLILPQGDTFGGPTGTEDDEPAAPPEIRARGLVTLLVLREPETGPKNAEAS